MSAVCTDYGRFSAELRQVARAVRTIGSGPCTSPEAILIAKHEAAERLFKLADRLEYVS